MEARISLTTRVAPPDYRQVLDSVVRTEVGQKLLLPLPPHHWHHIVSSGRCRGFTDCTTYRGSLALGLVNHSSAAGVRAAAATVRQTVIPYRAPPGYSCRQGNGVTLFRTSPCSV